MLSHGGQGVVNLMKQLRWVSVQCWEVGRRNAQSRWSGGGESDEAAEVGECSVLLDDA